MFILSKITLINDNKTRKQKQENKNKDLIVPHSAFGYKEGRLC